MNYVSMMYPVDNSRKDSAIKWEVSEARPFDKIGDRNVVASGTAKTYEKAGAAMTAAVQGLSGRK